MRHLKAAAVGAAQSILCVFLLLSVAYARADPPAPRPFDIGPQSLAAALGEFARQGQQEILFSPTIVSQRFSGGVRGTMEPLAALRILLKDSGLSFSTTPNGAILVGTSGAIQGERSTSDTPSPKDTTDARDQMPGKSVWDRFRLAQADTGRTSTDAAAGEPASNKDNSGKIEQVIVTAQKRAENLQEVPISAQVFDGPVLQQQNVNSLGTLSEMVPNMHISFHPRSGDLYIRGIGSGENQDFEQSVGTFIDDIYHGRARTTAATFLDLERVEILKGPQSTFFGNSAIAGALNIVTRKPGNHFDASARALYGEHGQYAAEAAVGGPITDTFGARVAVTASGMQGWLTNVTTGHKQPAQDSLAARVTLAYKPTDQLDATLKVEGSKVKRNDGIEYGQIVDCPPPPPFVATGFCSAALSLGVPTGINNNRNATKAGGGLSLSTTDAVLTANYREWGHTFTSVTGFYGYHFTDNLDGDGTPQLLLTSQAPEHYHQVSQELRVTSPTGQPIEYLGGLYFQSDYLFFRQDLSYFFLTPLFESIPPLAPLVPYLPLDQRTSLAQNERSYAAFGSVSWNVTDRLKLTGGLRGSWVKKDYDWNNFFGTATETYGGIVPLPDTLQPLAGAIGIGTPGTLSGSRSDRAWLPSAKVQYQIDPEAMVYFSYSKGFKAGGFNGANQTAVASNLPFAPEHVNAYEAGLKSRWLDDTVLLNLAVFRAEYSNLQVAVNINTGGNIRSLVQNAASSLSQGVELEGQWVITRDFHLSANVSYDDAHYVRYQNVSPTQLQILNGQASQDLSGRPTYFAPKWSGSLTGSYRIRLPADYELATDLTALRHLALLPGWNG
jgi:outer membrane receptor protein involved in Fe transport